MGSYKNALRIFENMSSGIKNLIMDAIVLESIENKKESEPFTNEQIEYMLKHRKIFDKIYFKPIYPNKTINHQFLKGFKVKDISSSVHTDYYVNIGLYQVTDKTKSHYGDLSFSVKHIYGTENETRWWIDEKDNNRKTFIPNKNIVFEHPEIQKIYLNADYSKLYKND